VRKSALEELLENPMYLPPKMTLCSNASRDGIGAGRSGNPDHKGSGDPLFLLMFMIEASIYLAP